MSVFLSSVCLSVCLPACLSVRLSVCVAFLRTCVGATAVAVSLALQTRLCFLLVRACELWRRFPFSLAQVLGDAEMSCPARRSARYLSTLRGPTAAPVFLYFFTKVRWGSRCVSGYSWVCQLVCVCVRVCMRVCVACTPSSNGAR